MDTGLSDLQIFELMRTADTNDDSRIDFKEFATRFEVIFTNVRDSVMEIDAVVPPPPPTSAVTHQLTRRASANEKAFNNIAASDIDSETMTVLVQIGRAMFLREVSKYL